MPLLTTLVQRERRMRGQGRKRSSRLSAILRTPAEAPDKEAKPLSILQTQLSCPARHCEAQSQAIPTESCSNHKIKSKYMVMFKPLCFGGNLLHCNKLGALFNLWTGQETLFALSFLYLYKFRIGQINLLKPHSALTFHYWVNNSIL